MQHTFYKLVKSLLEQYDKKQIFLRSSKHLGHAYKEVELITQPNTSNQDSQEIVEVMTYFFGLLGHSSPLPDYILDKFAKNEDDGAGFSLFFDFFNNHLLWLLYESATLRSYPRSFSHTLDDRISTILLKLLGLHNKDLAQEYLHFSPLILSMRKPKAYVEKVLQYNFHLHNKISIIENIPQQIPIDTTQKNALGAKNNKLGSHFVLGSTTFSFQNKILIHIRDIPYQEALNYLPQQAKYNKLKESVAFLTSNEFGADLALDILFNEKMHFVLGDSSCAQLGRGKILGRVTKPHHMMKMKLCD